MNKEDKQIIAIFDGLAHLSEAVLFLATIIAQKTEGDLFAVNKAMTAAAIFRKATSEASGTLDPQNTEKNSEEEAEDIEK